MNDPLIGHQLANFRVERILGRGGMAQVYFGQDIKLQRPVAIKVIDARYRGKPASVCECRPSIGFIFPRGDSL